MKLEIELGHPEVPSRDVSLMVIESLKYTSSGIRVAYVQGLINPRDYADLIADALDKEARRLEDLLTANSGMEKDDAALSAWLQGQLNQWFGDAVRKNPDMAFATPFGFRNGRHLLGLMGGRHE